MSCRLFPSASSRVHDHKPGRWARSGALIVVYVACLIPLAASAAGFTVSPTNLAFGNVPLGATGTIAVTITNTSGVAQTPNFAGGAPFDSTNFDGSQNCAGVLLAPGGTCKFTYTFSPKTLGPKASSTTIGINADNFPITMSGTGISAFNVAPTNLVFGNVAIGATGSIAVTITNTSGVSQTPNFAGGAPFDSTNFGGSQNCAGVSLAPGGTCKFTYTFSPKTPGPKSSSTTIGIDSQNFSITMSGTGTGAFTVAPMTINFGSVAVGTTSATMTAAVTNASGAAIGPLTIAGGAPGAPFNASQNCQGATLAPGAKCQVFYTFAPTAVGPASAPSNFTINGQAFSVSLSGIGQPAFTLAPTDIDFGPVLIGETSSVAATLTNVSGTPLGPLTVTGGGVGAPFAMTQNCQGATLPIGGSCRFVYTFTAVSTGFAVATSTFTINGTGFRVELLGSGSVTPAAPVAVVEFYNALLDHYFITHVADEIAKLDAGVVIKGWMRTGRSFPAFETAQTGTTDICRIYIIPLHGDSHFFGRGQQECDNTMAAHPDFVLEASRFMAMFLPVAGVCPAGTVPVYRVFSNRPDANHRYMIDRALRDQMVAEGWLPEGDGPDLVVLCAPS